jgi:hypothetical protein
MFRRLLLVALAAMLVLGGAACGDTASGAQVGDPDPSTGVDDGDGWVDPGDDDADENWDEFPVDLARDDARTVLGMHEEDLAPEVRVSRRGDDHMMLTEDYRLGRLTVELDDDGSGYRVVSVTVELPDGPETYDLEPS